MSGTARTGPSEDLGFGRRFTSHMALARYRPTNGWGDVGIVPFADLSLSPAAMVFHYGQAIFEGLKAFRQPDGSVALFRPGDYAARFNRSARRLVMPELPEGMFTSACAELVRVDAASVPSASRQALYLRPMMVATEEGLGVRPSTEYLFAVIASPVGSYFSSGGRPITVWATIEYARAVAGGTGSAKCSGNYGASLLAKREAAEHECDENLWLDAVERRWVQELGGMNVVFVAHGTHRPVLVTPPAGATILDGVIRRSVLELAPHRDYDVVEAPVPLELVCRPDCFSEAFACGTAAVVVPIAAVRSSSGDRVFAGCQPGPVATRLRDDLVAIQEGRADDPLGWRVPVSPLATAEDRRLPSGHALE